MIAADPVVLLHDRSAHYCARCCMDKLSPPQDTLCDVLGWHLIDQSNKSECWAEEGTTLKKRKREGIAGEGIISLLHRCELVDEDNTPHAFLRRLGVYNVGELSWVDLNEVDHVFLPTPHVTNNVLREKMSVFLQVQQLPDEPVIEFIAHSGARMQISAVADTLLMLGHRPNVAAACCRMLSSMTRIEISNTQKLDVVAEAMFGREMCRSPCTVFRGHLGHKRVMLLLEKLVVQLCAVESCRPHLVSSGLLETYLDGYEDPKTMMDILQACFSSARRHEDKRLKLETTKKFAEGMMSLARQSETLPTEIVSFFVDRLNQDERTMVLATRGAYTCLLTHAVVKTKQQKSLQADIVTLLTACVTKQNPKPWPMESFSPKIGVLVQPIQMVEEMRCAKNVEALCGIMCHEFKPDLDVGNGLRFINLCRHVLVHFDQLGMKWDLDKLSVLALTVEKTVSWLCDHIDYAHTQGQMDLLLCVYSSCYIGHDFFKAGVDFHLPCLSSGIKATEHMVQGKNLQVLSFHGIKLWSIYFDRNNLSSGSEEKGATTFQVLFSLVFNTTLDEQTCKLAQRVIALLCKTECVEMDRSALPMDEMKNLMHEAEGRKVMFSILWAAALFWSGNAGTRPNIRDIDWLLDEVMGKRFPAQVCRSDKQLHLVLPYLVSQLSVFYAPIFSESREAYKVFGIPSPAVVDSTRHLGYTLHAGLQLRAMTIFISSAYSHNCIQIERTCMMCEDFVLDMPKCQYLGIFHKDFSRLLSALQQVSSANIDKEEWTLLQNTGRNILSAMEANFNKRGPKELKIPEHVYKMFAPVAQ